MKVIYGINKIRKNRAAVVAMGVFDGVHRGHKEILKAAVAKARQVKGVSIVVTFWPHPQLQESLYSLEHRLRLFAELGIDLCVVINFTRHFSRISAVDFVKKVLVDKLCARYIYVGKDFRFGRNTQGSFILLEKLGERYGFEAKGFAIVKHRGRAISSTLIRGIIKQGKIREAQALLDRPVSILGTVVKGTSLGRILGFPTANINPHHEVIPAEGIYAVRIIFKRKKFMGACYIGRKPTVKSLKKAIGVEVYILNFKRNIYGENLEIQFVRKVRPDKKFSSLETLSSQIRKDIICVRKILLSASQKTTIYGYLNPK